uniref:G domain-containing protein n=1 Tax=Panagrolaimus davidi TaxID=227884 RepID=A0A914QJ44_9BILA
MNSFEIPRQQTDEKSKPEIMQFKSSQALLKPFENLKLKQSVADKRKESLPVPGSIIRSCLGRCAKIGQLYDVRTESLIDADNIFINSEVPKELVSIKLHHSLNVKYTSTSKITDKFAALNLNGEMSISLMAGLLEDSETVKYIFNQSFVGISFGELVAVTMASDGLSMNAANEIQHCYDKMKKINIKEFGENAEEKTDDSFEDALKLYTNLNSDETSFRDANEYLSNMAENYKTVKGKQLVLHLLPLKVVYQVFGVQKIDGPVVVDIQSATIQRFGQLFDTIFESYAKLQHLLHFIAQNKKLVSAEDVYQIVGYKEGFDSDVYRFCNNLRDLVQKVRSGESEAYKLEVLREMYECDQKASPIHVCAFVDSYKYLNEKVAFACECERNGILMITEADQLVQAKQASHDFGVYMLFCSFKNDTTLPSWEENLQLFYSLQNQLYETHLFAVVDTDIVMDELLSDGIHIVQCFNGEYVCDDYLELKKKMDSQCLVECEIMYQNDEINIKAVPINFPCPLCFNGPKEWVCAKCRHEIEYNFDGNFYCRCGFNAVEEFGFKCRDPTHENGYYSFTEAGLKNLIDDLKPLQEVNILVIGETGVGKSTWINALANYISHDTIDEVLKNDVINLIPTQFELTESKDGQLFQKSISVGTSKNENFAEGQSATQQTRAYTFRHNNCLYRIIDTPGIGDSRGIEQDKKNMENIMQFISLYKEIHGICVLMKPNESRITPSFEFCFKELLIQFHRSAIENIVFCFTQTSGFNFEVGQTLTPLTVLLDEIERKQQITIPKTSERMYAFDNMAYRYLCAVKYYGSEFPPDQQELYKRSYNISKEVTQKMFEYFLNRKAHNVEESMSICRARNIIRRLTHPMAMINTGIEETLEKVKNKEKLIQRFIHDEEELRKILVKQIPFKRWYIEVLDHRYCGACSTLEYYYGNDRLQFAEADPEVMDTNPFVMTIPKHLLKRKKDKCPQCGPNTKSVFSSRWFYSEMGTREEEDTTIAGQMKEKLKTREGIEHEIQNVKRLKDELLAENAKVVKASAKFACYLSRYSITPYNDATAKYLKMLIEREEKKGIESKKKIRYENLLSQYDAEKMALEKQLKNPLNSGDVAITTSDITELVENLKKLKHYGRDIAAAIGECNKAIIHEASDEEMEICLPNQSKSKFNNFFGWAWKMVKRN